MLTLLFIIALQEPVPLFNGEGVPQGWFVTEWSDVAKPSDAQWRATKGILLSGNKRGTWLMSEKQYENFILEFEINLTERGNSGVALRSPRQGDPAFDGMELQIADLRYNPQAKPSELTGGIYRAIAPIKQVYRPTEWNSVRIELRGNHLKATINGEVIQDIDLNEHAEVVKRHDGSDAKPIKDRPKRGHIGFQHLSRNNERIMIRHAKLTELK
jgi:hypothetical protein